jgi:hypothetical protein
MPKRGEFDEIKLRPGPLRELTQAVRDCCRILRNGGMSMVEIAAKCLMSKSTLYRMHGGQLKRPNAGHVEVLYRLTEERAGERATHVPALDELMLLCMQVALESKHPTGCDRCGRLWVAIPPPSTVAEPAPVGVPLLERVNVEPVPFVSGDRQVDWEHIADLKARLADGQASDAAGILRHVGRYGDSAEAAAAIAACHREGLDDEVGVLIAYAAERADAEILYLVRVLLEEDEYIGRAKELVTLRLEAR